MSSKSDAPAYSGYPPPTTGVQFEDVMKQPNSPLRIPGLNTFFSLAFTYTQAAIYTILTLITGIIFTVVWGIVFAVTSYVTIWVLKPVLRLILDLVTPIGAINRFFVRTFLDPMFGSIGQMFAYLRGQFGLNVSGISREQTRASVQNV
ncbi:caveolin-1-like [Antedon mediterranea]|uniref:caveolin-1-like n=1 Tax=Antedon mediterranea TaxID=105859 RepID=UPI003AF9336A